MNVIPAFTFRRGAVPLLISIPHAGTEVPVAVAQRFTPAGRELPDTDWHVDELYGFAADLGASIIEASYSRYVVDLNRAADSSSLYESSPTSPVCPTHTFGGAPIYVEDRGLDAGEIGSRIEQYWRPYHTQIEAELQRMRAEWGIALLWDAHSIASEVPGLFAGILPELNFGTRDHAACPQPIAAALLDLVVTDGKFSAVLNGRFKGGYITLHHGRPSQSIYAVQLELAQRAYMDEATRGAWDAQRARSAQELIAALLERYLKARSER